MWGAPLLGCLGGWGKVGPAFCPLSQLHPDLISPHRREGREATAPVTAAPIPQLPPLHLRSQNPVLAAKEAHDYSAPSQEAIDAFQVGAGGDGAVLCGSPEHLPRS